MPDLAAFAKRIRKLGKNIPVNADQLLILTAGAVNQTVVLATPHDTGRARGNWQISIGAPITEEIERLDPTGQATINANQTVIKSIQGKSRQGKRSIFLTNNLSYIQPLNEGTSSQAPAGFVEQAVRAGVRAAKKVKLLRRR